MGWMVYSSFTYLSGEVGVIYITYTTDFADIYTLIPCSCGITITKLDIIWFAYSRGVRNSLFRCSRHKDTPVTGVCLRHVETILRDRFFLINFAFVCMQWRKVIHRITYPKFDSPFHGEHGDANCNSVHPFVRKLQSF